MAQEAKLPFPVVTVRALVFHCLMVPPKVPLQYEFQWMRRRLFEDTSKRACQGLGDHVYEWFSDLETKMKKLERFIEKNQGKMFENNVHQFMYGSLLETMRDLLAKIMRATLGPERIEHTIDEMNKRLAPFLQGVDGSKGYDFSKK